MPAVDVVSRTLAWYDDAARDLPWRRPDATPWGVLVSEIMLQQTPVSRVLAPWEQWLRRWPRPADLAAAAPADVIRAWGRLGYPRRALRLREAAQAIVARHGGEVPRDLADLRSLPGVGEYTAAAVASFAYGRRHVVLDTNVRRLLSRVDAGEALPAAHLTRVERERAERYLPADAATAARWAVASMELAALVCIARSPRCGACPLTSQCAWLAAGRPATVSTRAPQPWEGTDRQCRGRLLARLRASSPVPTSALIAEWPDAEQAERCLDSLLADGLARRLEDLVDLPG